MKWIFTFEIFGLHFKGQTYLNFKIITKKTTSIYKCKCYINI